VPTGSARGGGRISEGKGETSTPLPFVREGEKDAKKKAIKISGETPCGRKKEMSLLEAPWGGNNGSKKKE